MNPNRRKMLALCAAAGTLPAAGALAAPSQPATLAALGIDVARFGVRPGSLDDQTRALQRAIDETARVRVPLVLGPGLYRAGDLKLSSGSRLVGIAGATRLVLTEGASLVSASRADHVTLSGLILDGAAQPLPGDRGLIHFGLGQSIRIEDCEIVASGRHGIVLEAVEGEVTGTTISAAAGAAIFSLDARGLKIADNTIRGAGNNGILVWRSARGDDGTIIVNNRIEDIAARAGGAGQNGNAVNIFRAANVLVYGNRICGAAFSAVRGNAASGLQVLGNTCAGLGEVALYAEFGFEAAVIANNVVDGAALGVAITNFSQGGRLAVVQGNIIRNLSPKRPDGADPDDLAGVGIGVEADTAVTGNVIEDAPTAGIHVGWGPHLRDVAVTGNVVRTAGVGIAVSVVPGAGSAVIADNLISGARRGAIVGMEGRKPVTGDLASDGAGRFAQLAISGNRVR